MAKFIPVEPEKWAEMVKAWAENVRLETENGQLQTELARLKAEVERLTKSGDAMAEDLIGEFGSYNSVNDWNSAKKGGQP